MEELLCSFQNKSALVINTDIMIQAASSRRLYSADMTAVSDRRQLHGHQERRGRARVTRGQRVRGMLIGMSWAAARGPSHQRHNNKDQRLPGEPWQWTTRPRVCRDTQWPTEGGGGGGGGQGWYTHIHPPYSGQSATLLHIMLTHIYSLLLSYIHNTVKSFKMSYLCETKKIS